MDPSRSGSPPQGKPGGDRDGLTALLEALLFAAARPVSLQELAGAAGVSQAEAAAALEDLDTALASPRRGLQLLLVAGGYRLVTKPAFTPAVRRLLPAAEPARPSRAALETLAIIAYRQPVTRAEVEAIRGVRSERALAALVERGLIEEVGRADGPGRPVLYGTTQAFLDAFGLRDLHDLPPLPELAAGPHTFPGPRDSNGGTGSSSPPRG